MSDTESSQPSPADGETPTVLVVDDDKDLADTYAVWLSDHCDVETAYGGLEARKRLRDDLDVVLLDRRMPGIPGDTILEEIREQGLTCQVAMLTAVEPDTDIIDLPFDEYIVKPATQSELRKTIDDLLLRAGFDTEAQEYFAMEAKSEVLEGREQSNLRDPDAAADFRRETEQTGESERIQTLKRQLERLRRISSVIRDIDKQLVVATSRDEIEQTVCERLVDAEPYELAWIGDYTVSFEQTTPRAVAGEDAHLDGEPRTDGGDGPIAKAVSTRSVQVVEELAADGQQLLEPVESGLETDAFTAGAVVPLIYRDTVYGVLTVCTDQGSVFDDREVAVLSELGDSIANAINSVESKKLMLSDVVVELEFDIKDKRDVFVSLSAETGSRIELKGFVPASNGELTSYLEVTGTSTEQFLNAAAEMADIQTIRGIGESGDDHLYECRVADSSIVLALIEAGASVESMWVDEGASHLTATVAPETDVRTIVETIQEQFAEIDLVAKRETERDLQSTEDFRQSLENRLTDRQYSVLQAAFSAGYFDWPRGSTAKEIANSLDLAPPTLHEHLRGAQKELIQTFFEETGEFGDTERLRPEED